MDTTAIIIFLLISIVLGILLYKQFNKPKIQAKPTSTTKEEIVLKYQNIVIKFMEENKDLYKKEIITPKLYLRFLEDIEDEILSDFRRIG